MPDNIVAADLITKIEKAFAHRSLPPETADMEGRFQIDSDVEDALWFQGRKWNEVTVENWRHRHWGLIFFSPKAFAYYLPSILILTLQDPNGYPDLAVDSFLWQLDHSPGVENLDPHLIDRYSELTEEEYRAIREWLLWACQNIPNVFVGEASGGPGDGFGRAFDTLDLLRKMKREHPTTDGDH